LKILAIEPLEDAKVSIDPKADLVWLTVGMYDFFMAHGKLGMDAMRVFLHLIYTARLQHNNRVRATTKYIVNGTHMGQARVKAAKKFLKGGEYISYHRAMPQKGAPYMGQVFIRIRFAPLSTGSKPNLLSTGTVSTRVEIEPSNSQGEKERKGGTKSDATSPLVSSEHLRIAEKIADHVTSLDSKTFFRKDRGKTICSWADEIRKLEKLDGRTIAEIDAVLDWAIRSDFWQTNIQSGGKLREKFSTLLIQSKGNGNGSRIFPVQQLLWCPACKKIEDSSSPQCTHCGTDLIKEEQPI
jgi:hypothetical protein